VRGTGSDVDTLVASAKAYVNALNKLVVKRGRTADLPAMGVARG
jgi:2-isopropylmalate synthase